jgi:hypothetical protein
MPYFPQLASGSPAQFPLQKLRVERTAVNSCLDGHTIKLADTGAAYLQWQLALQNLTDAELNALEQFFETCEGRLNAFTFLDPTANLLTWSEALDQPAWQTSTLLQMAANIVDPNGGTGATRLTNPTASDLTLQQTIAGPGWFTYCFSVYGRSQSGGQVTLTWQSGSTAVTRTYHVQPAWTRLLMPLGATPTNTAESVTAGVVIAAGQPVDIFGFQLEAQPSASVYKPVFSTGGVYSAHFADDNFVFTTDGPNRHHTTVKVIAP